MKKILSLTLFLSWNISSAFAMDTQNTQEELINKFCNAFLQHFTKGLKITEEIILSGDAPELASCLKTISTEKYVEPIKSFLRQIPHGDLVGWYEIYGNPKVQEFVNQISRAHFLIEKYAREAENKSVVEKCAPAGFMGDICNALRPLFSKRMGELKINTELTESALFYFFEDLNKKYADEIMLLNKADDRYKIYDKQLTIILEKVART